MKQSKEEAFFKEVMSNSKLEVPFPDLEDNVMMQIKENHVNQKIFLNNIRLSWVFFIIGSVFGFILAFALPQLQSSILGITSTQLAISLQVIIIVILLTQLDRLITITRKGELDLSN